MLEKIVVLDDKLTAVKELLLATRTSVGDIYVVPKETGSDVSKLRVMMLKTAEKAVKAFKEVYDHVDGVSVTMNSSFDRLKEAICNTLTYFLHH